MEENTPHPKEKKKRNDVSLRKNKETEYSCVKVSWKKFNKNHFLRFGIQNIILNINKISFLSYKLLNFHFIRLIENNMDLPEITQNLFYNACSVVSIMKNRNSYIDENDELVKSFNEFKNFIDDLPFRDKMGNLINNLNRQQLTMTKNHLKLNFYKRLHKYLELKTGENRKSVIYQWLKIIYADEYNGNNPFLHSIRKFLKYVPTESNICKYASHFIKVYYKILIEFEKYENKKGIRVFNLLPNKSSFTIDNIEICNSCLNDVISYITNKPNIEDFNENKRDYWTYLFNIEKYETENRKFAYGIMTDGKSCSIRLEKPKKEILKQKDIKNNEYEQYIGIDPGIRSLYTSYNNQGEIQHITTREYRHRSKMIYACKKRENWYKKWDYYDNWKKIPSFKTARIDKMLDYLKFVLPNIDKFFQFHKDKNFRGLNFTSYCRSKATLDRICKKITNNKRTLIGFGDYSQQHGLVKKHPTTPILKLKRELSRHCDLIDIDEYKTSKTCSMCFREVTLYRNYKNKRISNFHSVIRCSSNECKLCCMDRDINASKNILLLLECEKQGKRRPKCFLAEKNE